MFQIGDINVRGMSSEMVATVLRQCGTQVRLIVARGISEPTPEMQVGDYMRDIVMYCYNCSSHTYGYKFASCILFS